MNWNIRKVITISQKEFTDNIWNPVFLALLMCFSLMTIAYSLRYGAIETFFIGFMSDSVPGISSGLISYSGDLGKFIPLFGIALSFDILLKEEKSGSLNVLLTHPVYRDNIIAGKILGSMISLFLALLVALSLAIGTLMVVTGESLTTMELFRIAIFFVISYMYAVLFMGTGLIISLFVKDLSDSLIYNVVLWLFFIVVFKDVLRAVILLSGYTFADDGTGSLLLEQMLHLSPLYHYQQLVSEVFDTGYTLSQLLGKYWTNLAVLAITPFTLFILSFIRFLRRDITL